MQTFGACLAESLESWQSESNSEVNRGKDRTRCGWGRAISMPSSFCPLPHPHSSSSHFSGRSSPRESWKGANLDGPSGVFFTHSSFYRNKHYYYPGSLSLNFSMFLSQRRPKPRPHIRKPTRLMEARSFLEPADCCPRRRDNKEAPGVHLWIALPGTGGPVFNWHPKKHCDTPVTAASSPSRLKELVLRFHESQGRNSTSPRWLPKPHNLS